MTSPAPLVGILQPGEEVRRTYSTPLSEGMLAVLQKGVGAGAATLEIVEQSERFMHLANRGTVIAPYMILFMTDKQLRALLAARELCSQIFDAAKNRKLKGKPRP